MIDIKMKCNKCFWWSLNEDDKLGGRRMCMRVTEDKAGAHAGSYDRSMFLFTSPNFGCTDFEPYTVWARDGTSFRKVE